MSSVPLHDNPFTGMSRSITRWSGGRTSFDCQRCGSSLAKRRESVRRTTTAGVAYVVETFRCRCGRGRRLTRPVGTGSS
jgi:hypothetical protein